MCILDQLFDKIYVINLLRSTDRKKYITNYFNSEGIKQYEFFQATDHDDDILEKYADKVISYPPCFRCGLDSCGKDDCNNVLIKPQIAVFVTYLRLWSKISKLKQRVLVVEDDVVFNPWWRDGLKALKSEIDSGKIKFKASDSSLIRLGWAKNNDHQQGLFYFNKDVKMSNPCHALTSEFCRKLLDEFEVIDHTVDVFLHKNSEASEQFGLTMFPPIAYEKSWSEGTMPSLIHPKEKYIDTIRLEQGDEAAHEYQKSIEYHKKFIAHR